MIILPRHILKLEVQIPVPWTSGLRMYKQTSGLFGPEVRLHFRRPEVYGIFQIGGLRHFYRPEVRLHFRRPEVYGTFSDRISACTFADRRSTALFKPEVYGTFEDWKSAALVNWSRIWTYDISCEIYVRPPL